MIIAFALWSMGLAAQMKQNKVIKDG